MNGVNLIDFTMPSAVPAPAGKSEGVKRVGGFKIILSDKKDEEALKEPVKREEARRVDWIRIILLLTGLILVFELAKWYARRYGK